MKKILRSFLITLTALWVSSQILPAFVFAGGLKTLLIGTLFFLLIHLLVIPLIKILLLPLNLLTLGLFAWISNVVGLYFLTVIIPQFRLLPYSFPGVNINGFVVPATTLTVLQVAIVASFLIGLISHFLAWLVKEKE